MSRRVIQVLAALLGVAVVIAGTERLYFYPLTPLALDLAGDTRLPPAGSVVRPRLLFVGDTLLGDSAAATLAYRGHDYPFAATRRLIESADLAVGNLEGPIAVGGRRADKTWSYRMPPLAALALQRAGFDAMNLANNHIRDCGDEGVRESRAWLRAAGVASFGAGTDEAEAHRPALLTVRGVRVALLGYTAPQIEMEQGIRSMRDVAWGPGQGGAAWGTRQLIARDLRRARTQADLVIVSLHIGDRYQETPTPYERALCRAVIDAGADAVVGHGTHILGPVESHRGRPILYSLGNFAFGSVNAFARFSLMAFLELGSSRPSGALRDKAAELDPRRRQVVAVQLLPIYTMNANPWVWFQPKVLEGGQARRVLGRLQRLSTAPLTMEQAPPRLVWRASPRISSIAPATGLLEYD